MRHSRPRFSAAAMFRVQPREAGRVLVQATRVLLLMWHRVITRFLVKQAGLRRDAADTGAVTLIQRFGSAANLNIHLHCLVLDGVYRHAAGEPVFQDARPPTRDELQGLLDKVIARLMKMLTRQGYLIEEQGMTYLADMGPDHPLKALQAASCTYRIAFGPRCVCRWRIA